MTRVIDTLGKAARHSMLVRVECGCGNIRYYRAMDLAMVAGAGRDPRDLPFRCTRCRPRRPTVTVLEIDRDRMPRIDIWEPHTMGGKTRWLPTRLK